jgi:hypothetical protein
MSGARAELIGRLEAAGAGSRDLDMDIAKSLGFRPIATIRGVQIHNPKQAPGVSWGLPHYTTSLDAAVKLVPEGKWWTGGAGKTRPDERLYGAAIYEPVVGEPQRIADGEHDTSAAIALCIAALKARAASEPTP